MAVSDCDGAIIVKPVMNALGNEITFRKIDMLMIVPFVTSHRAGDNTNCIAGLASQLSA